MIVWEDHPTVPVHSLTDDIAWEFQDIPLDVLAHYLVLSAVEACREADLDRRVAMVHTRAHVERYLLAPQDKSDVVAVLDVEQVRGADRTRRLRKFLQPPNGPYCGIGFWFDLPERTLHIVTRSLHPGVFRVAFSVCPQPDTCEVPASFAREHRQILLDGARSRAYAMLGRPWFSADLAAEYTRRFRRGYGTAKVDRMHGGLRGTCRMGYRRII
jgi:hypothetical protein